MAHDGSLASKTEAWIVTQLEALSALADRHVEMWPGSTAQTGEQLVAEITSGKASPILTVLFEGDRPIRLEEGAQGYEPVYAIYVAVRNSRPAAARIGETIGDDVTYGTNGLRDLLRGALDDKCPAQSAGGYYTDRTEFRGVRLVFQKSGVFVMRAEVVVRESPAAS